MKVCERCGVEIDTRDGDNLCRDCDDGRKRAKRRAARKAREAVLRSLGLTKVRGALGGTYWE
jgi:NMD protein affecting ribosome stability and mRNA decay